MNADELGDENGSDQIGHLDTDFVPHGRGHLDDRADAVVVEPEGDEENEELSISGDFPEGA